MSVSSGIVVSLSDPINFYYGDINVDNITISNASLEEESSTAVTLPFIDTGSSGQAIIQTGATGASGHTLGPNVLSGSGVPTINLLDQGVVYRKNLTNTGQTSISGHLDLDFTWDSLQKNNEIVTLTDDLALGYVIKIYNLNGKLEKRFEPSVLTTGFDSTGASGFAGDGFNTGYFFTGVSGFAGSTGIVQGLTGGTGTGFFTYSNTTGGTTTGLSDMWGLVESGFTTSQNTYILASGTGVYGILESGFDVTKSGYNTNSFTLPAVDQYNIFSGDDAKFVIEVENSTVDGRVFSDRKVVQILKPRVDLASFTFEKDTISTLINSDSSTKIRIEDTDSNLIGQDLDTFIQIPDGKTINYRIIPEDQFGTGTTFNVTDTGGALINFSNEAIISGLSAQQINIGTDPGLRLGWNVVDKLALDTGKDFIINDYYNQKIQVFDPTRDGSFTTPFEPTIEAKNLLKFNNVSGAIISGGTGFGHGLTNYEHTGTSGFAGATGFTGEGTGIILANSNTGTGLLTYEPLNTLLYDTGSFDVAFGLKDSGNFIISDVLEKPLSENLFNYEDLVAVTPESGNVADITFKDCNCTSGQAGFFLWLTTPSTDEFITGKFVTGDVFQNFFIENSTFGLNNAPNYDVSLTLGSGNLITSSKASPGLMKLVSTNESDQSKDILFADISGFGSTGAGDIEISLGASNKIISDGSGNLNFTSNTGTEDTSLFNITTDPETPSVFKSDLEIHMPQTGYNTTGYKLFFGSEGQNTDSIFFTRVDTENDFSELRLYLGDNFGDSNHNDKFVIGSTAHPSTDMQATLTVQSGPTGEIIISGTTIIDYASLPSSDPSRRGQLYRDASNFLKISAG